MAEQRFTNGVNVSRLVESRNAVEADPDAGKCVFRATNRWAGAGHCCTTIQDFSMGGSEDTSRPKPFVLDADEPDALLGADHGPNATEALLFALSSCLCTSFIYHAAAQGVNVRQLEIDLDGDLDVRGFMGVAPDVRNGYQQIRLRFKVDADASEEEIQQLCQLAQQRSPVFDSVAHGVPISATAQLVSTTDKAPSPSI